MPLRPVDTATGIPLSFDQYPDAEKRSHIIATHRELGGVFGVAAQVDARRIDVLNVRRCLEFGRQLPDALRDADVQTALADFTDLLDRVGPARAGARA